MLSKCDRGSEWYRWDFHVHTPASYSSQYPDNWDLYIKELILAIRKHNISAFATADYFTIAGYSQMLNYYDKATNTLSVDGESIEVYIVPGVELRLNIFNNSNESINFHILFDPENCGIDFIEENYLEKLKISYRAISYDLKERSLVAIGNAIVEGTDVNITRDYSGVNSIDKQRYLKAAYSTISLSQFDINQASKTISDIFETQNLHKKPYLKIIAGKGHGSLKSLKWFDEQKQLSRM